MKRFIASILLVAVFITSSPIQAFAESTSDNNKEEEPASIGEIGGYLEGNIKTVKNLNIERKFTYGGGHGFAAERANNLADVLKGKNATVVGDDNAKNGPDRKIINRNGEVTLIQDKYYSSAGKSVSAAFDEETGLYRYIDGEGKPMQLEVPADQYDKAVESMAKKIEAGQVPGVTDPNEASNIVRKGKLTYQQAVNVTKAGNIDSLKYDATNGTIVALSAMGISFVLDFALCKYNGLDNKEALKEASLNGLKTGGVVFATYVISSQLAKTGLPAAMAPMTDAIAKNLGRGLSEAIVRLYGVEAAELSSTQIASKVSSILQSQIITAGVTVVVLTAPDIVDLFRGRISKEQLLQDLVVTVLSVGGTYTGSVAGGVVGSLILPGGGTTAGRIIGGIAGGAATGILSKTVVNKFFKSDSDKMYEIISAKFEAMCVDYLISESEANDLVDDLKEKLTGSVLKDMYQSEDREKFATDLMTPLFESKVASREKIVIPTEEETRTAMLNSMEGIIFVH